MASLEQPSLAEEAANHGPGVVAGNLVVAILATIAVALRFLSRYIQKNGFKSDDYLILLALPFGWGMCASTLVAVHYGLGKHISTLLPEQSVKQAQAFLASQFIWAASTLPIKLSILLLYLRIFGQLRYLRNVAYGLGIFSACSSVMVIIVLAVQCRPIQLIWNKNLDGICIDSWPFYIAGSTPNVLSDFAILILPLPAVWNLQIGTTQKVSVVGILLLGSLTCIISLVRLVTLIKDINNTDLTWTLSFVAIWSTAEPCLGIVAACLPTLRPVFRRLFAQQSSKGGGSSYLSSPFRSHNRIKSSQSKDVRQFHPLDDSEGDAGMCNTSVHGDGDDNEGLDGPHGIPMNVIKVQTRWENKREPV